MTTNSNKNMNTKTEQEESMGGDESRRGGQGSSSNNNSNRSNSGVLEVHSNGIDGRSIDFPLLTTAGPNTPSSSSTDRFLSFGCPRSSFPILDNNECCGCEHSSRYPSFEVRQQEEGRKRRRTARSEQEAASSSTTLFLLNIIDSALEIIDAPDEKFKQLLQVREQGTSRTSTSTSTKKKDSTSSTPLR